MFSKIMEVIRIRNDSLYAHIEKPRYPCPFYGFYWALGETFMDLKANQCGLMAMGRVCQMEHCPSGPDWSSCSFNCKDNEQKILEIIKYSRIVPDEFWPKGAKFWKGISMSAWMDYVMNSKTLRPKKMSETTNQKIGT